MLATMPIELTCTDGRNSSTISLTIIVQVQASSLNVANTFPTAPIPRGIQLHELVSSCSYIDPRTVQFGITGREYRQHKSVICELVDDHIESRCLDVKVVKLMRRCRGGGEDSGRVVISIIIPHIISIEIWRHTLMSA